MSRPAFGLLLTAAAALAGVIMLEIAGRSGNDDAVISNSPRLPAPAPRSAAAPAARQAASWAEAALARPLFSPTRRPAPRAETPVPAAQAGLPRVAGILVSPGGRSVIFAAAAGGKPVVAREGGQVGAYQVQRIEAGRVTVVGPDGPRVLVASFDASAPVRPPPGAFSGAFPGAPPGMPPGMPPAVLPGVPPVALGPLPGAPASTSLGTFPGVNLNGLVGLPGVPLPPAPPAGPRP